MTVHDAERLGALANPAMDRAAIDVRRGFRVITIEDSAEFEALKDEWDHLLSVTEDGTVFKSWEWAFSWWQAFGQDKQLKIVAVRDSRSRLVALWPLYRSRVPCLGLRLSALRLLGTGQGVGPDYMGCLTSTEGASVAVAALVDWLEENRHEWDLLQFAEIRADAPWTEQLANESSERGWPACAVPRSRCFYVELPDSWDAYCNQLAGPVRRTYRRRMRNLERFDPRYFRWEDADGLNTALGKLGELHRRRWEKEGEAHCAFSTPGYVRFHELLAPRLQKRGWLSLYCMSVNNEIISMLYTFEHNRVVYAYQSGIDPDWGDFSVGTALRWFMLQDCIARGIREVDFLKGEHSYKTECADRVRQTANLLVNNSTLGGRAEFLQRSAAGLSRSAIRRAVPAPLRQFVRRVRRRRRRSVQQSQ